MSGAAPARKRRKAPPAVKVTAGTFPCPRSIAENLALFTHAELELALIVQRRDPGSPVSDEHWTRWTGSDPRMKRYAAAGLVKKGLRVQGQGDSASYSWDSHTWQHYVRTTPREKPRTEGRRIDPKPEPKPMHASCLEHGCQLTNPPGSNSREVCGEKSPETTGNKKAVLVMPNDLAGKVLETGFQASEPGVSWNVQRTAATSSRTKGESLSILRGDERAKAGEGVVDQTSRDNRDLERVWVSALGALRGCFPLVGVVFLLRLIDACRAAGFDDVTDSELSRSVAKAWATKRRSQATEGLFLYTVPEALALLRREPPPRVAIPEPRDTKHMARCVELLKARGDPYTGIAARVDALAMELVDGENAGKVEEALTALEGELIAIAAAARTHEQKEATLAAVEKELAPYRGKLTAGQLAAIERQFFGKHVLEAAGLPRLGLFYA